MISRHFSDWYVLKFLHVIFLINYVIKNISKIEVWDFSRK